MDGHAIEELIPHRGRMRLIDVLVEASQSGGTTRTRVRDTWPLVAEGRVDPLVLIEVVAQSAGVLAGWKRRHLESVGGRGWLVGVRHTKLTARPLALQTELIIRVEVVYEMENYAVFKGWVSAADEVLAEVEIQTFRPSDDGLDLGKEEA